MFSEDRALNTDCTFETLPKNTLVSVCIYRDYRKCGDRYIANFLGYSEKLDNADCGHAYSLVKGQTVAGGTGARKEDILFIEPINSWEAELWHKNYVEFHDAIIKECGYDICEEDVSEIKFYTGKPFFVNVEKPSQVI